MAEDDSFIREVNEEIRQEKARALWGKFGPMIIGAAVALVLGTAVWQGYSYWQNKKAGTIGDAMLTAESLVKGGKVDEAIAALKQIESSEFGGYPSLAQMREAGLTLEQGNKQAAVAMFDKIAQNSDTPSALKDIASIRAAYILVDTADFNELSQRVTVFASDNNPMRLSAREILGLSAWKVGNLAEAKNYFEQIINDSESAGSGVAARAQLMLSLINSRTESAKG
ncbi:tetratricopeptide repeat protein [Bartonella sp. HY038]|uniref:tetratricopeptide repeat protein n=1 Tax=Bartonella sp. HY038 TaxID=2759660 RepID=UPI0015F8E70D|nr:tetratricopeptide repeat protein [Bartonella sp. HY038]